MNKGATTHPDQGRLELQKRFRKLFAGPLDLLGYALSIVFMKTLVCGEGSQEEVNNGTTVPLKKGPFRAFSSHPF